ncbi:MAG TPA: TetR/AcrR family transcriptional regulator [Devosia sp.]|nr:TetR/AcrR family transcriptional regulator [Devosia sp.]
MGRKQTIDRGALLDAAERVVLRDGAGQLTMDAVAAEAGVSKGGVLYAFPSKDALIDALFARVFAAMDAIAEAFLAAEGDSPQNRIRAHVLGSRGSSELVTERSLALMANFMRSPQYRQGAQDYYREVLGGLDLSTPAGRRARLALLATEGALMLRGFDFHPITEADWQDIHADILEILLG